MGSFQAPPSIHQQPRSHLLAAGSSGPDSRPGRRGRLRDGSGSGSSFQAPPSCHQQPRSRSSCGGFVRARLVAAEEGKAEGRLRFRQLRSVVEETMERPRLRWWPVGRLLLRCFAARTPNGTRERKEEEYSLWPFLFFYLENFSVLSAIHFYSDGSDAI